MIRRKVHRPALAGGVLFTQQIHERAMAEKETNQNDGARFLDGLVAGHRKFKQGPFRDYKSLFERLARKGQSPKALVIACCDSRVDPALITESDPGDLFVIRNVANLVPPYEPDGRRHGTSAALEFAVQSLNVNHIIVMGHSHCGGAAALAHRHAQGERTGEFITQWMAIADRACEAVSVEAGHAPTRDQSRAIEQEVVKVSLENLLSFPWVQSRVDNGEIALHGWYFDIETASLSAWDPKAGDFQPL